MKSKLKSCIFALVALYGCHLGMAADSPGGPRVINITAGNGNAMKFNVSSITAAPGEVIKVVLTNASTLPKAVMGHNWILLKAGTDLAAFAQAGAAEPATGYIPSKFKDQIIAHIRLLGPKESGEVIFTVPTEPGDYPFLCSFPAHNLMGMKGVVTVK